MLFIYKLELGLVSAFELTIFLEPVSFECRKNDLDWNETNVCYDPAWFDGAVGILRAGRRGGGL